MNSGFEIAKETLRLEASRMRGHGDDYEAAVQRLQERNGRWGDDGLFAEIEMAWVECRQTVLAAVPSLGGMIGRMSHGMHAVSANIDAADAASTLPETAAWQ
ncbi:hypothetical protein [Nonomuraea helvata]|uniref:WXG100 family type VII secretion target n=1 Tax=Nonomuraea helvata TaxID=37484 RepID=A0ABV5S7K0_9ACTN